MPKKRQSNPVQIRFPNAYTYSLMANRFAIQREDGFILTHFGLIDKSNTLLDSAACIFSDFTLESQKENLVQYSDKLPAIKTEVPKWTPTKWEASDFKSLPVIDFIHVTNWGDKCAEICLMNYSQAQSSDLNRAGEGSMTAWGVALIRCHIDIQAALLLALYDKD